MIVTCSLFKHAKDNTPKPWSGPWADLVSNLGRTFDPEKMPAGEDPKKGLPAISGTTFNPLHRGKEEAQSIQLLGLDYDNARDEVIPGELHKSGTPKTRKVLIDNPVTMLEVSDAMRKAGVAAYQWTTWSNKDGWPKHRAVVALETPVPAGQWEAATEWALAHLGLLDTRRGLDLKALRDVARIYFLPGHPGGADAISRTEVSGAALLVPLDELPAIVVPPIPALPHIQRIRDEREKAGYAWAGPLPIDLATLRLAELLKAMDVKVGPPRPHGQDGTKWRTHCLWPEEHSGQVDSDDAFIIHTPGRWPTWSCSHGCHLHLNLEDVLRAAGGL